MSRLKMGMRYDLHLSTPGKPDKKWSVFNVIPNEGLRYLAEVLFTGGETATSSWYLMLVDSGYTPVVASTLETTAANEVIAYTSTPTNTAVRAGWVLDTLIAEEAMTGEFEGTITVTNSASPAVFTFTGADTVRHIGLTTDGVLSAHTGILLSTADLGADQAVTDGSVLRVTANFVVNETPAEPV